MDITPIVRARPPVSPGLRRLTGAAVLPLSVMVMAPFLAAYALYAGVALTVRGLGKVPRALIDMVDFAGSAVLGH